MALRVCAAYTETRKRFCAAERAARGCGCGLAEVSKIRRFALLLLRLRSGAFRSELEAALAELEPPALAAAREVQLRRFAPVALPAARGPFHCAKHNASIGFSADDGSLNMLSLGGRAVLVAGSGALGRVEYQNWAEKTDFLKRCIRTGCGVPTAEHGIGYAPPPVSKPFEGKALCFFTFRS